uniref:Uncharacterized protein n=1 Tax=Arundo donax TaxID=35708 RepID=A0A0A9H923_ARUDO
MQGYFGQRKYDDPVGARAELAVSRGNDSTNAGMPRRTDACLLGVGRTTTEKGRWRQITHDRHALATNPSSPSIRRRILLVKRVKLPNRLLQLVSYACACIAQKHLPVTGRDQRHKVSKSHL